MIDQIRGLHHVTSLAGDAQQNNDFFTKTLGLRRVKKTVNFDAPDVYHLYYGDAQGTPGSVMTYFPFPGIVKGTPGAGEVGETQFSVPTGSLGYWENRLHEHGVEGLKRGESFGSERLSFQGPDGDGFALVERDNDTRPVWDAGGPDADVAIRGFLGVRMRLMDDGATSELLQFMGYEKAEEHRNQVRFAARNGNGADFVDLEILPDAKASRQGAGSVHHVAFAVEDRAAQLEVRKALSDTGYQVTPVIDRDYFWAIYFRSPGGVLFEVATNEPGFDRDEDPAHLGESLRIPTQHEAIRDRIEASLPPIND
ncbi:MAG: VOC family protein [Pseudomonadota bacterium]